MTLFLLLVLIGLPFVVAVVRARWISDALAEIDFERWERETK
jgi:hypothetical protein